jgi:hypothetical protein
MGYLMKRMWFLNTKLILFVVTTLFLASACGPSPREEREAEEAKRKAELTELQNQWQVRLSELSGRYNAVTLDKQLNSGSYTYELQQFFDEHSGQNIIVEGYLEDLERVQNGTIVEIAYKLNKSQFGAPSLIIFRLKTEGDTIKQILGAERVTGWEREFMFMAKPNCIALAQVDSISKVKRYEHNASGDDEDTIQVSVDTPHRYVAKGHLVHLHLKDQSQ